MGSNTSEWPLVSVVLLNYNSQEFLSGCLVTLLRTAYPNFEVIFVDNGSSDSSVAVANNLLLDFGRSVVLENHRNFGFAQGNNIGARRAKGKYIVFLNVDTEVDSGWLLELVRVIESDVRIGAAQGKLFMSRDKNKLDSVGHYLDYTGVESMDSAKAEGAPDDGTHAEVKDIFYAKGACIIDRASLFWSIGGFDSEYFTDHEEIDL